MPKNSARKNLGAWGENIARQYYQKLGYKIVGQNLWTRAGEIDLLVAKNNKIILVEVKTRRNRNFGLAEESVSETKLEHLINAYYSLRDGLSLPMEFDLEICAIEIIKNKAIVSRFLI